MPSGTSPHPLLVTLYVLVVFAAVAALAVYALRFMSRRWTGAGARGRQLHLLEQLYVAPNRSVCLVAVPGKILVLGVAERSVDVLTVLDDPELVASLQPAPAGAASGAGPFASVLGRMLSRGGEPAPPHDDVRESAALAAGLARLRELQQRQGAGQ